MYCASVYHVLEASFKSPVSLLYCFCKILWRLYIVTSAVFHLNTTSFFLHHSMTIFVSYSMLFICHTIFTCHLFVSSFSSYPSVPFFLLFNSSASLGSLFFYHLLVSFTFPASSFSKFSNIIIFLRSQFLSPYIFPCLSSPLFFSFLSFSISSFSTLSVSQYISSPFHL